MGEAAKGEQSPGKQPWGCSTWVPAHVGTPAGHGRPCWGRGVSSFSEGSFLRGWAAAQSRFVPRALKARTEGFAP